MHTAMGRYGIPRNKIHLTEADYDTMIAGATKVITTETQNMTEVAYAFYDRGLAYKKKGEFDKAISDYTRSIRIKPDFAHAYYNRGSAYDCVKDYDRALSDFNEALRLYPAMPYCTEKCIDNTKKWIEIILKEKLTKNVD